MYIDLQMNLFKLCFFHEIFHQPPTSMNILKSLLCCILDLTRGTFKTFIFHL